MSIFRRRYVRESCDVIINAKKSENDAELMRVLYSAAPAKCSSSTKLTKRDAAKFLPDNLVGFEKNTIITNFDALEYFTSVDVLKYRIGFFGCTSLQSIKLPQGITSLEAYSFRNCTSLKKLHLPDSVVRLNGEWGLGSSFEVNMPPFIETMGNNSFNCSTLKKVVVPKTLKTLGADAFRGSPIEECVFEEGIGITEIPNNCFYTCSNLKYVYIPDGITRIGDMAFCKTGLTQITLPNSIVELDNNGLSLTKIKNIALGNNLKRIGSNCFYACGLVGITIPESVETMSTDSLIYNDLKSLHIPQNVTSLSLGHDLGRTMESLSVSPKNTVYDSRENCNAIIETATNTLLLGCAYTKIPEGVEKIAKHAFYYMNNVVHHSTLIFPSTLKEFLGKNFDYTSMVGMKIIFLSQTPPIVTSGESLGFSYAPAIYVPDDSIDAYLESSLLSESQKSKIKPLSEFEE
jgi:hypothetical protein